MRYTGDYTMKKNPTVDVIIPAYKPGKTYIMLLEALERQSYPINRILVINTEEKYYTELMFNNSLDRVYDNIHVSHISKREFNHGKTRREGVAKSEADIFIMMTDDAVPKNDDMVANLISPIISGKAVVSYARQVAPKGSDEIEKFTRNFNYPRKSKLKGSKDLPELGIKTYFCSDVCAAYNRKVYDELGGFEEYVIFNEDMIFAAHAVNAGYKIAYTASAEVYHSHNYGNIALFKRNFDLGVSQADHPEIFKKVSSTGEGKKLVRKTIEHLKKRKKKKLIPKLIINSGFKYLGYKFGLLYSYLPKWIVSKFSSMPEYWVGRDVFENNRKAGVENTCYGINASERQDGRKIHKASDNVSTYHEGNRKTTLRDEIKVRPKDKMIDRSGIKDNKHDVAWKSDNDKGE